MTRPTLLPVPIHPCTPFTHVAHSEPLAPARCIKPARQVCMGRCLNSRRWKGEGSIPPRMGKSGGAGEMSGTLPPSPNSLSLPHRGSQPLPLHFSPSHESLPPPSYPRPCRLVTLCTLCPLLNARGGVAHPRRLSPIRPLLKLPPGPFAHTSRNYNIGGGVG